MVMIELTSCYSSGGLGSSGVIFDDVHRHFVFLTRTKTCLNKLGLGWWYSLNNLSIFFFLFTKQFILFYYM